MVTTAKPAPSASPGPGISFAPLRIALYDCANAAGTTARMKRMASSRFIVSSPQVLVVRERGPAAEDPVVAGSHGANEVDLLEEAVVGRMGHERRVERGRVGKRREVRHQRLEQSG